MDSFIELAKKRFSCRAYKDQDVPKDLVERVMEAARIAPSAVNNQPWLFIALKEESLRKRVASCYARNWLESAPLIIVACGDHSKSWRRADGKDHCDIDVTIAIDHLMLSATEHGLATCWVCKFDAMKCSQILELPSNITPIALIPIGFPAEEPKENRHNERRKPLNEILFWDGVKF